MPRYRPGCTLLLGLIVGVSVLGERAAAQDTQPPALTVKSAFSGYFRTGHFIELNVTVETAQQPIRGELIVSSDTIVVRKAVNLQAPSIRNFKFLVAPNSLHPAVSVRLVSGGSVAASARPSSLKAIRDEQGGDSARLAALLGTTAARFGELLSALPGDSRLVRTEPRDLPQDFRGYEPLDLLIIGDLSSDLAKPHRRAVTAWLRGGGRMLVVMPANGLDSASSFWRRFFPAEVIGPGLEPPKLRQALQSAGLDVFTDEKHSGLVGFNFGLGKVLLSTYGQGPATATQQARREIAQAVVSLLGLDEPRGRSGSSLIDPGVYELFEESGWPRSTRTVIWLSSLGYALAMVIVLKVLGRERPAVFGASTGAFTAAFAAVVCFVILPGSTVAVQSASIAHTQAGSSALIATRYLHFASPADAAFRARFALPAKPVFYSDMMLSRGPAYARQLSDAWLYDLPAGGGGVSCFQQTCVVGFSGRIEVGEIQQGRFDVTNNAASAATGEPMAFTDFILTDASVGAWVGELPAGHTVSAALSPGKSVRLGRLIWDRFAAEHPARFRMLRYWLAQHRPESGVYLLGWSRLHPMPPLQGRFLSREENDTLWEIRIR